MSDVAIVRCPNYDKDVVEKALSKALEAVPLPPLAGKVVLLKPNVLSDAPVRKAITTNPQILKALIRLIKTKSPKEILVGDSPGLQPPSFRPNAAGIVQVCEEEDVRWVDFTKDTVEREVPYTGGMKLPFARIFDTVDVLITLPKAKTHKLMYATGALKNQFGLVPGLHKSPCHVAKQSREDFADLIVGINTLFKPSWCLMDAIIAMEGDGPANGTPRHMGLLLASRDPVAMDWAEGVLMGYDPTTLPVVTQALKHGLGQKPSYPLLNAGDLAFKDWQRIPQRKSNLVRDLLLPFFTRRFKHEQKRPAPVFGSPDCILCQRCVQICPANALTVRGKTIEIDQRRCVRCYCCHEMCPANAITIKERV